MGKTARLNQFFNLFSGDILFLIDADIVISNESLLASIIKQTNFSKDGIVSVQPRPIPATNFFEASINYSVFMQNELRSKWNNGKNYLAFRGCFLGLDKTFAKSILLHPNLISQDAYMYFLAKSQGYKTRYIDTLFVSYKSPHTFQDHYNQSIRHSESYKELDTFLMHRKGHSHLFPKSIYMYTLIPRLLFFRSFTKYFFSHPIYFSSYCMITLRVKLKRTVALSALWEQALSTKHVNI